MSVRSIQFGFLVLFLTTMAFSSESVGAIVNGDFETPGVAPDAFAGWTTLDAGVFYDRPSAGNDVAGRFAVFTEAASPLIGTQLEQLLNLPADALTLSFDYQIETSGTSNGLPPDNFQSSLLDVVFSPILPADPQLGPAYYSIDNLGNQTFDPTFVTVSSSGTGLRSGWKRVGLDVSSVVPQDDVTIEFLLSTFFEDGVTTTVSLDNVVLARGTAAPAIPEASSIVIWTVVLAGASLAMRRSIVRHGGTPS